MEDHDFYKNDIIGLKTLNENGRLFNKQIPRMNHNQ